MYLGDNNAPLRSSDWGVALTTLTSLRSLSVIGTTIGDEGIAAVSRMTGMTELNICHCQFISADAFPRLASLTSLETLYACGTNMPGECLCDGIGMLPLLRELDVSGCDGVAKYWPTFELRARIMLLEAGYPVQPFHRVRGLSEAMSILRQQDGLPKFERFSHDARWEEEDREEEEAEGDREEEAEGDREGEDELH